MSPSSAFAAAAIIRPTHYNDNLVARGDDTSNLVVNLPFTMNWMGTNYTQVYINMNGNLTFTSAFASYQPSALSGVGQAIIAPFWADVNTTNVNGGQVTYSNVTSGTIPTYQGHKAFMVNWENVMYYYNAAANASPPPNNSFQVVIVDRSDTGSGNFDIMFNYDTMNWDLGTASGTDYARAGWSTANGTNGSYELPGSGVSGALLDSGAAASSLVQNYQNPDGVLGRYIWQVRTGSAPNVPPKITVVNRTLQGNCSAGFLGYTGSGDASATDADGQVWDFHSNLPAVLPLGTTAVTWTATDDDGAVTTATQSVTVTDTIPPSNPGLSSATGTGVWTNNNVVSVVGTGVTDVCSGLRGFSYSWTQNATATPDTTMDACTTSTVTGSTTTTVTQTDTRTVDGQPFATSTWPTAWTRSDATYIRLTNTAGRYYDSYAAEAWANNTTRRTVNFYRDYSLGGYTSASVTLWDQAVGFAGGSDYERIEYSTDGGTTWTQIENVTASTSAAWHSYALPVTGTVRLRFSASVNATTEYADWDDITVYGYTTTVTPVVTTSSVTSMAVTSTVSDGVWYFNVRSVDSVGNWSGATSLGPFYIDTVKPTTTSNAPSGWSTGTVNVSLVATDPSGPVAYTRYKLDAGALATYTVPVVVSGDGTHTLLFYSADLAGNVESTKSATVQIDSTPPSTPTSVSASALSTTSAEIDWNASSDSISGVAYYAVYRNGSLVGTTTATTYTDTGLTPGSAETYYVVAYNRAGLASPNSTTASVTIPVSGLWMTISATAVDMGSANPGVPSTVTSATMVQVGGVGTITYDLLCSATDFSNTTTGSTTPTMPAATLSYSTSGWITVGPQSFSTAPHLLNTSTGTKYVWEQDYRFDYIFTVPWAYAPATYATTVTYTVTSH